MENGPCTLLDESAEHAASRCDRLDRVEHGGIVCSPIAGGAELETLIFFGGIGLIAYIALWVFMPAGNIKPSPDA